jgi:Ni,Fe-hydrogenase III large subunit
VSGVDHPIPELDVALRRLDAPLPIWLGEVGVEDWQWVQRAVVTAGGRLVALWGTRRGASASPLFSVCAAYGVPAGLVCLELALDPADPRYPDVSETFRCAGRMQRAQADLLGIVADGARDARPWLDHGLWGEGFRPLADDGALPLADPGRSGAAYPFVRVEGDGVHEIPVGPVHAGIIEPGHFRFSIVGEKVLRLEERLGYKHKGIERKFAELHPVGAARLAGRVSGDSTVAFAWAYCMALESATGCRVSQRARRLRALMLERERVANHLGDLGALGNDAALAFGLAQFSRLREDWQRTSAQAFGHRFMMDCVAPGGVARDVDAASLARMREECDRMALAVVEMRLIYEEHAGLQDRFMTTGEVSPDLAARLGLTGLAGRASGQAHDLRSDFPWAPYDELEVRKAGSERGDVAARVAVRFAEAVESLRLISILCEDAGEGAVRTPLALPGGPARGVGWVEGWRGEVLVSLETQGDRIVRCHCHDPSWQNWPVLEHAVIGNIVPDFPLINKSFNLSYAGHDL